VSQPLYKTPNTSILVPYQLLIQQYTIPVQNIRTQQTQLHQPTKKVTPSNKDKQEIFAIRLNYHNQESNSTIKDTSPNN